jgi:alpha-glucoside transport system substrate-binding protein
VASRHEIAASTRDSAGWLTTRPKVVHMRRRSTVGAILTGSAVALLTAGCLSPDSGDNTTSSIEIMYGFTADQDKDFQAAFTDFLSENPDIRIRFSPSPNFDDLIKTRVQGNQLPDIGLFTHPRTLAPIARSGKLADLSTIVDLAGLKKTMAPGTLEAGQVDGTQYGVMVDATITGLVYHAKKGPQASTFPRPPQTFDELLTLSKQIAAGGATPWCVGTEQGSDAGGAAADWLENVMLAEYGVDVYQQWVNHEIPFDDPRVVAVTDKIEQLLLADGMTHGGRESFAADAPGSGGRALFDDDPGCYLYRQSNAFVDPGVLPDAIAGNLDSDVGVFPFPGTTTGPKPILGGGAMVTLFSRRNAAAQKVVQYMASQQFQEKLTPTGWYLSPRRDVDPGSYPNETTRTVAGLVTGAAQFVVDGSDQMPDAVGARSFPKEMVAWMSGAETAKQALDNVEASWPK